MTSWLQYVLILCAISLVAVFSTYRLTESPPLWYDEGYYLQAAVSVAERGVQSMQVAPGVYESTQYVTAGFPLIYPVGASIWIFGDSVGAARAPMVLFIALFCVAAYVLVRRIHNPYVAAWGVLALASFPLLYGNGKSVLGEVPGLLFLMCALLSLWLLERSQYREWRYYLLVGVMSGLALASKPIFILFVVALMLTWLLRWRSVPVTLVGVAAAFVGFMSVLAIWILTQFGGDATLSSLVAYYANPYEIDLLQALQSNIVRLVSDVTPLMTLMLVVLWGIGLALRRRSGVSSAELAGFIFCVLIILAFLRLEGWYRYLFPAAAVALPFAPAALIVLFDRIRFVLPKLLQTPWIPAVALAVMVIFQYSQLLSGSFVAQYYDSHRVRNLAALLHAYDSDTSFFIYNVPEVAILLPSKNFYQYIDAHARVQIGEEQLEVLRSGGADVTIVDKGLYEVRPGDFARYTLARSINNYRILELQ
ncbi:glycosyltransferase family 39 protein [Candidatus Nomurabacteria bacterium]|nr:glycosyltransferase family 39 protein [Candidatus Nomurabacteria bacterium]